MPSIIRSDAPAIIFNTNVDLAAAATHVAELNIAQTAEVADIEQ